MEGPSSLGSRESQGGAGTLFPGPGAYLGQPIHPCPCRQDSLGFLAITPGKLAPGTQGRQRAGVFPLPWPARPPPCRAAAGALISPGDPRRCCQRFMVTPIALTCPPEGTARRAAGGRDRNSPSSARSPLPISCSPACLPCPRQPGHSLNPRCNSQVCPALGGAPSTSPGLPSSPATPKSFALPPADQRLPVLDSSE